MQWKVVFNEHRKDICWYMCATKDPNFEALNCRPLPWLLSSQMQRFWPATEIFPQTANASWVRWTLRSLQPIQLMRRPAMDVSGVPWTLALACATYGPQRWWGSRAPKAHQKSQELRSSWFPQNLNSSIVCGLSFPSISHLQTVALFYIASWHSDVKSRQFQLDKAGIHSDLMD